MSSRLRTYAGFPALVLIASATAIGVYLLGPSGVSDGASAKAATAPVTPTAQDFARAFVGTTNAYAAANGDDTRIGNADCVQASRGRYMCSLLLQEAGRETRVRHHAGALDAPKRASTIAVTLAGRATRCGSLDEALRSLA